MNIVLEIIIFNVVVFTICGINMAKKGRLGLIQEYPKAIQDRCRELGLIEESSGKLMKKATIGKIGFFIGYIVLQTVLAYYIGGIYENLTAWENMKVRALLLGIPDEKIQKVLKTVDLTDTGKKKAGAFSLGMKQRLGIGLALLNDPKLLVLDEPVNGLDPLGIQELRALIRSFPQKGITVIISSHILSEIQQTADYIGIIAKGTVGFEGKLQEQQDLEALFMKVVAKGGNES